MKGTQIGQQGQQQINLSIENASDVACEKCGSIYFDIVYQIKKFSALLTGAPKDTVVPMQTFCCAKCGYINAEFVIPQSPSKMKEEGKKLILDAKEEPKEPGK